MTFCAPSEEFLRRLGHARAAVGLLFVLMTLVPFAAGHTEPLPAALAEPVGLAGCSYPLAGDRDPEDADVMRCDQAIESHSEFDMARSEALIVRGYLRWNADGDWDRTVLDLVLSEHGDYALPPPARFLRARTWQMMGMWQRAIDEQTKLIAALPTCGECHHERAIAYLEFGNDAAALQDLLEAKMFGVASLDDQIAKTRSALGR